MRVLITGANGFVGRYLASELSTHGMDVEGVDLAFDAPVPEARSTAMLDIRDAGAVSRHFRENPPDACVHLAAIAFVPDADRDPSRLLAINVGGTMNVINAVMDDAPCCRLLTVSTSQVYGPASDEQSLDETTALRPGSAYAISKAAADAATLGAAFAHGVDALTVRPANHTGPGQPSSFVVPAFAARLAALKGGRDGTKLLVGNLDSRRAFTDVRDVVRAYRLLLEKGEAGQAYNLCSGAHLSMSDLLDRLASLVGVAPDYCVDASLYRPTDAFPHLDCSALREATGWEPQMSLDQTLADVVESLA